MKIFRFLLNAVIVTIFLSLFVLQRPLWADEISILVEQTESKDFNTWYDAYQKLGNIKSEKSVHALIKILKTAREPNRREYAIKALTTYETYQDPQTTDVLIEILKKDPEPSVRAYAANALPDFKDPKAIPPLIEALKDQDNFVKEWSAEALGKFASNGQADPKALDALLQMLANDPTPSVRDSAALGLGGFKDPRAVDALITALQDQDYLVRSFAASSLGSIGDQKAVDPLRAQLSDSNETARGYAAESLKKLGVGAETALEAGKPREALEQYMAELAYNKWNDDLRKKIIDIVAQMDPKPVIPEEAEKAMARGKVEFQTAQTQDQWKKAGEEFQKSVDLAPWWPDAYYNLALVQEKQLEFSKAASNLKLYLYALPTASDAAQVKDKIYQLEYKQENLNKAYDLINKAADFQNANQPDSAIPLLQEAIRLAPDYYLAHSNLGRAYEAKNEFKEAIPELKEGIRLGDHSLGVYFSLAYSYEQGEENIDAAISTLEEGIRYNPYSSEAGSYGPMIASVHRNLGWYYWKKGNNQKAIENYEKAITDGHAKSDDLRQDIQNIKTQAGM